MFKCLSLKQALVGIFPEYCNYRCQNERTLLPSGVQPCSDWWVTGPHAGVKCTQSVRLSGIDAVTEQSQSSHSADKLILQHGPGSLTSRAWVGRIILNILWHLFWGTKSRQQKSSAGDSITTEPLIFLTSQQNCTRPYLSAIDVQILYNLRIRRFHIFCVFCWVGCRWGKKLLAFSAIN